MANTDDEIKRKLLEKFPNMSPDVLEVNEMGTGIEDVDETRTFKNQSKVIHMAPFAKARPRVTRRGTFMPTSYKRKRRRLRTLFGSVIVTGPVRLSVIAIRKMPSSWSEKKREMMRGAFTQATPDIDNILGAVMDALFENDQRVVAIGPSAKIWGENWGMSITIEGLQDEG